MCPAAGALPQPGPAFQALPEPAPLPPLPRPGPQLQTMPAEAMAAMAPMSAMAGEAQPGAQLQVCQWSLTSQLLPISPLSCAPLEVQLLWRLCWFQHSLCSVLIEVGSSAWDGPSTRKALVRSGWKGEIRICSHL